MKSLITTAQAYTSQNRFAYSQSAALATSRCCLRLASLIASACSWKVHVFSSGCHCTRHYFDFHFDLFQFVSHLFVNKFNFLVCRSRKCHASLPARHRSSLPRTQHRHLCAAQPQRRLLASFICNLVILYTQAVLVGWEDGPARYTVTHKPDSAPASKDLHRTTIFVSNIYEHPVGAQQLFAAYTCTYVADCFLC